MSSAAGGLVKAFFTYATFVKLRQHIFPEKTSTD
jgi:hypothetical protein